MGLYKLLPKVGTHDAVDETGTTTTYKSGDTIETDVELDKSFPEKFQRLDVEELRNFQQPTIPVPARFVKSNAVPFDKIEYLGSGNKVIATVNGNNIHKVKYRSRKLSFLEI